MLTPTTDIYGTKKKKANTTQNVLQQAMPTLSASTTGMQNTIGPTTLPTTDMGLNNGVGAMTGNTSGQSTSFTTPGGGNLSYNTPFWDQIMKAIQDYTSGISDKTGAIEGAINQQQGSLNDIFQQIIGMTGTNVDPQYQQYADQIYNAQKSGLQSLYGTQLGNMTNQALSGLADRGVINSSAFGSAMTDVNQSLGQTLGNQLTQLEMNYPQMAMQLRNEDRTALGSAYGAGTQNLGTYSGAANQTFGNWSNAQSGLMSGLMDTIAPIFEEYDNTFDILNFMVKNGLDPRSMSKLQQQQAIELMRQQTQEALRLASEKQKLENDPDYANRWP